MPTATDFPKHTEVYDARYGHGEVDSMRHGRLFVYFPFTDRLISYDHEACERLMQTALDGDDFEPVPCGHDLSA